MGFDIEFAPSLVEGVKVIEHSTNYEQVNAAVDSAQERGVEIWQMNFHISAEGVALDKCIGDNMLIDFNEISEATICSIVVAR